MEKPDQNKIQAFFDAKFYSKDDFDKEFEKLSTLEKIATTTALNFAIMIFKKINDVHCNEKMDIKL